MIEIPSVPEMTYKWIQAGRDKRFNYLYGGASSGKSWALALYLVAEKFYGESGVGIMALRKVRPAVKDSCWRLVRYWLKKLGKPYRENKSDLIITNPVNGNFFSFNGLDNVEKKKSLEGINYIWCEEATEFTKREFLQLNLRCRAQNENGINQLFCTFNPVDPIGNAWLKERTDKGDTDDARVLMVTHGNNPFLSPEERKQIDSLADQDEEYNKIYRQGLWATPTNLIYNRWDIVEKLPDQFDDIYWGLDFGYSSNPAALIEVRFCGDEVYEHEHIYQTGLTNPELIELMKLIISNNNQMIIADCAEPKSIQEIRNAGFNIHGCHKGTDSVRFGINAVKSVFTHITNESVNLIEEKQGYKWKVDKDDNVLPEPLKFKDHLMDAERYVISKVKGLVKAGLSIAEDDEIGGDEYDEWDEYKRG